MWNVCEKATFSIQFIEKLPGNSYENWIKDNAMLEYRLHREDYWMKTPRTVYPFGLNERTKFMNKDSPIGKPFPLPPRYGKHFIDSRTRPT